MNILQAILLGIVEGLTEYIPVSSTAHLLITQRLLGVNDANIVEPFTIIIQSGAIIALVIYFWKDLWDITVSTTRNLPRVFRFNALPRNAKMGWYLLLATIPAAIAGLKFNDELGGLFAQPLLHSAVRLSIAAILMASAEYISKQTKEIASITWKESLVAGLFQVLAVFPGASRSGSTISGGMLMGLSRKAAAKFAMLMSAPIMLAATAYELIKLFKDGLSGAYLLPILVGTVISGIVGWFSIKWLLKYVQGHSLYLFSIYCVVMAVVSLAFHFAGI